MPEAAPDGAAVIIGAAPRMTLTITIRSCPCRRSARLIRTVDADVELSKRLTFGVEPIENTAVRCEPQEPVGVLKELADMYGIVLRLRKVGWSVPCKFSGAEIELVQTWRRKPDGSTLVFQHVRNKITRW